MIFGTFLSLVGYALSIAFIQVAENFGPATSFSYIVAFPLSIIAGLLIYFIYPHTLSAFTKLEESPIKLWFGKVFSTLAISFAAGLFSMEYISEPSDIIGSDDIPEAVFDANPEL